MPEPASTRLGLIGPTGSTDSIALGDDITNAIIAQLDAVGAGFLQGTSRPAASGPLEGFFYVNTSTGLVSYCTGSVWLDVSLPSTTLGRSLLNAADAAAGRTALGISDLNVQTFTANGTWTKPTGATLVEVIAIGGGGGGSGGARRAAGVASDGGGGGAGGTLQVARFLSGDLTGTVAVAVGAGGSGGAAASSDNTSGTSGVGAGTSTFGAFVRAPGGAGSSGTLGGVNEYGAGTGGGAGGPGKSGMGVSGGGGGAGGGVDATNVAQQGALGGSAIIAGGSGGSGGSSGSAGSAGGSSPRAPGSGGGGGGGGTSAGANGGAGGSYGGGGGGGGGTRNGFGAGNGGAGAPGLVVVITT